ncbi:hypothetical protein NLX83_21895 [Allokutzneria sp. A3M-2-11 16]|uniref:transaldolase family protein n=1 Tax=Allokutzneria sp. A3M-2-11 16 TaxID=2962043 RepID=UPI0020B8A50C|nr:transaldolase family protein [Allokutzneria sp. A3M-2-11 16]MCP3801924.1 hypothetical protein [Allokutzneria sp. A3M-2-11 16]
MKIFLDTPDLSIVEQWLPQGIVDGVTTNPTLLRKSGIEDVMGAVSALARRIAPRDLSVQVSGTSHDEMVEQARRYTEIGDNIVIKVPVISPDGEPNLDVMTTLHGLGIPVNATACLNTAQVLAAAKTGARYASLLWGRVGDEGGSPETLVADITDLLRRHHFATQLLIGSMRSPADITRALTAGADAVTVPPPLLRRWLDHQYSRATVREFQIDAGVKDA